MRFYRKNLPNTGWSMAVRWKRERQFLVLGSLRNH